MLWLSPYFYWDEEEKFVVVESFPSHLNDSLSRRHAMVDLPALVEKALVDIGYDLFEIAGEGWVRASVSGSMPGGVLVRVVHDGTLLAMRDEGTAARIGLEPYGECPSEMASVGLARSPQALHAALRLLRTIATFPAARLSAEVEARLARIPATERTREVQERIGQDAFRDALMDFWDGRCALSGRLLPPALLRASHAKPWAHATNSERLDPFNGLLLAVQYDALFDKGLIAFDDEGSLLLSEAIEEEVREFVGLSGSMRLRFVLPGHLGYLRYHREHVAKLRTG